VLPGDVHFRRLAVGFGRLVSTELFVDGTEGNDHIIVEQVRNNLFVNVNGVVERFNAADVQFLSISGLGGDDDIVNASAIPSTISGGDGADTLWGGTGPDVLRGFGGNDSLRGGDGDDVLLGDTGNDTLHGGDGFDTLTGGKGDDALLFGEVDDRVRVAALGANGVLSVTGTEGADFMTARASGGQLLVSLDNVTTQAFALADVRLIDVRGLGGTDHLKMDRLLPIPVRLDGGAGNDELTGGAGEDLLRRRRRRHALRKPRRRPIGGRGRQRCARRRRRQQLVRWRAGSRRHATCRRRRGYR